MSNEEKEKASHIAEVCNMTYLAMENDGGVYEVDSFADCERAAMIMAEWKNIQAVEAYCKCCDTRECEKSDTCDRLEKFKEVMQKTISAIIN